MKSKTMASGRLVNGELPSIGVLKIKPLEIRHLTCQIRGTAPYVQNKMRASVIAEMTEAVQKPQTRARRKASARSLEEEYQGCIHRCVDGWSGIPTNALFKAMVRACKIVGFEMTDAKMTLSVVAQGISEERVPLVRLHGEPKRLVLPVVTKGVPNISVRAMWEQWRVNDLRIEYDKNIFELNDVANLLTRAGKQVGIGSGRPFSASSAGMGWGTFEVDDIHSDDK